MLTYAAARRDPDDRATKLQRELKEINGLFKLVTPEELARSKVLSDILFETYYALGTLLSQSDVRHEEESVAQQPVPGKPIFAADTREGQRLHAFERIFKNVDPDDIADLTEHGQNSELLRGAINVGNFIIYAHDYLMAPILWNRDFNPNNKFRKEKEEPGKSNRGITFLVNEARRIRDGESPKYNDSQVSVLIAILKALSMLKGNVVRDNFHDYDDRIGTMSDEFIRAEVEKAVKSSHRLVRG